MKNHLSKKEMAALMASRVSTSGEATYREHLSSCSRCSKYYERLKMVQQPFFRDDVTLPRDHRDRVIKSLAAMGAEGRRNRVMMKRTAGLLVPAAVFAILAVVIILLKIPAQDGPDRPAVSKVVGRVLVNGIIAESGAVLRNGALMTIERGAMFEISGPGHRLFIMGPGEFVLEHAEKRRLFGQVNVIYRINMGTMVSVKDTGYRGLNLLYVTPFGRLLSRGTRFMIDVSGTGAKVYLFSGSIVLTGPGGDGDVSPEPGRKYSMPDLVREGLIDKSDRERARVIEAMVPPGGSGRGAARKGSVDVVQETGDERVPVYKSIEKIKPGASLRDREILREQRRDRREVNRVMKRERRDMRRNGKHGRD